MADRKKNTHVSDVLAEVFRRGGMKRSMRRAEAVLLWPQVVGRDVARFTEASSLQGGVLFVDVSDSETAMHLSLQRERFLDVYRGKFGVREVNDIRFRVGLRVAPPEPPPPPPPPADPKELARLARGLGELELPEELAGGAMRAAKAMLSYRARRRMEGWEPCPTCGALTDAEDLCETCRRYAEEPRVRKAAQTLAVAPLAATPLLSDDERAVATRLARERLEEAVLELLPQVLADPALKGELEAVARCLLALRLGKGPDELAEDDWARLEPRVARALGRWS